MTSKSSDDNSDDDAGDDVKPDVAAWDEIVEDLGVTHIVVVIARYDKDGNQIGFEVEAEPTLDVYAEYGMLVHATELLRDVMVNGDIVGFEWDGDVDFDDDEEIDGKDEPES